MTEAVLRRREVLEHAVADSRDVDSGRLAGRLLACARAGWGYAVDAGGTLRHRFDN